MFAQSDTAEKPRAILTQALRAVESDAAGPVGLRWYERLQRDSTDRAALLGLATLARLTYDYPRSDLLYPRVFRLDSLHPDSYAAYARIGLAWSLEERGRSDAAAEEFARGRQTARKAADPRAEAEALIGRAFSIGPTAGIAAAKSVIDSAAKLIPAAAFDLQAERGWRRAMILGLLGDSSATSEAIASVQLARRSGELRVQAQAYRGLARVLDWRGKEDSALAAFGEAEERFRVSRDHSWLAVTLMNRANTLRKRGDLGETVLALQGALVEGRLSRNLWAIASAHTGLGVVAMQLNDFSGAQGHLDTAVTMFERQNDRSSAMNAGKFLAFIALADGDFAGARRRTLEALSFYQGTGETLDQFGAEQTPATIAMRERDWPAAERALADAGALLPKLDGPKWKADLAYDDGRVALARGQLGRAERSFLQFEQALDTARHLSRYDARLRLADVYVQRHELERAKREATAAWNELDHWRTTLSDRELRLLAFQVVASENEVSPASVSEQRASVARVLAALAGDSGLAPVAFELAERRRARELVDRLLQGEALRTSGSAHSLSQIASPLAASASRMAGLIPDNHTAILEYVTGGLGAPTTLLVLTRPDSRGAVVRARILPPADSLAGEVARFLALLQRGSDVNGVARRFGSVLLDPVLPALDSGISRLVVIPDGPLHRIPWDLLRLADGRYLVERYSVSLAPSALILATLWTHPDTGTTAGLTPVLAFGDPEFSRAAWALPRLPASGREAQLVGHYSPESVVRLGKDASALYLKQAPLDRFRLIHFATHAIVDERSLSHTILALAPSSGDSGLVGPGDLAALKLGARLVVLSGCRTAGGVVVEGEGVQGLTAPLMQAGARSVMASQWRVGDRSSYRFIADFYQALAEGLPAGDALRAAKLDALRRGAAPAEWAAFTLVGDPMVRVGLRPLPPNRKLVALLLAVAAVGLFAVVYWKIRTRRAA